MAPRVSFGQLARDLRRDVEELQIDVGDVELARKPLADLVFGDEAVLDQNAAELAPAAALLVQADLQLLLRDELLLYQRLAEPEFFRSTHAAPLWYERAKEATKPPSPSLITVTKVREP